MKSGRIYTEWLTEITFGKWDYISSFIYILYGFESLPYQIFIIKNKDKNNILNF